MKHSILLAVSTASLLTGVSGCTSDDVVTGFRSDGVAVTCEGQGDDLSKCTPSDGDDLCEDWEDGGAANVLWPPNHKLVRFTLEACGAVTDDCTPPDDGPINLVSNPPTAAPVSITSITADEEVEVGAAAMATPRTTTSRSSMM